MYELIIHHDTGIKREGEKLIKDPDSYGHVYLELKNDEDNIICGILSGIDFSKPENILSTYQKYIIHGKERLEIARKYESQHPNDKILHSKAIQITEDQYIKSKQILAEYNQYLGHAVPSEIYGMFGNNCAHFVNKVYREIGLEGDYTRHYRKSELQQINTDLTDNYKTFFDLYPGDESRTIFSNDDIKTVAKKYNVPISAISKKDNAGLYTKPHALALGIEAPKYFYTIDSNIQLMEQMDDKVEKISKYSVKTKDFGSDIIQGMASNYEVVKKEGYIEEIKIKKQLFLEQTADVLNVIIPYGHDSLGYLLLEAVRWMPTIKGHKKIIKELISYGADINYQRPKEYGSDRELSYGENTALESAFISNDLEVIEFLLESGARITSHILQGIVRFPQIISVPSFALVQFLLDRNVDITKYNDNGNILHGVVWGTNMAKFLLKLGVNLNETTSDGETPLHLAIKYEQYERAKLLIKNGADLIIKDNKGNTPLDVCPTERILHDLKQYLKDSNYISQEIYQNICDPTLDQCLFNLIAFTQRCDPTKDMRIMKLLINAGANINARDTDGTPAAVHAARGGDLNFFQFYLEHGADITVCDAKGMNVLLSAICSGQNLSLINFILQKKVIDMYTKAIRDEDFGEENALDIILSNWKNDVEFNTSALNLLIENGFKIHETDLQGLANQAKNQFLELQDKITSSQEKDISLKTDDFLSQPDLFDTYNQITTNNLGHTFIQFGISSVSMECMGKNDNELDI